MPACGGKRSLKRPHVAAPAVQSEIANRQSVDEAFPSRDHLAAGDRRGIGLSK